MCALSTNENSTSTNIKAYPNPTTDKLNIDIESDCSVTIYNSIGQQIKTVNLYKGSNEINISPLAAGVYYFKTDSNYISKVIKK